ncbi:MAG: methyl-accepting chemotaxis protein [Lachnospiraceae bacterium]|nr:methyl-accepting chemotaxis protein [Lachnospiraceae bacterium]
MKIHPKWSVDLPKIRFGIRYQILLSFLIPIVFIILVGAIAYGKAASGMREKYVSSTNETMKMAAAQVDLVSAFVKAEAMRYSFDDELFRLTTGKYDDDPQARNQAADAVSANINATQTGNKYLRHIHVITKDGQRMFSTKRSMPLGFLEEYVDTMQGSSGWFDSHPLLDEKLSFQEDSDAYLFGYHAATQSKAAVIVMDISQAAMQEFLDGINLGEGSTIALVTMNGREISHRSGKALDWKDENVFAGSKTYEQIKTLIGEGVQSGTSEIHYHGEDSLLFHAVCEESGCVVCALVPLSTVTAQASEIRLITFIVVLIALLIASAVGLWITIRIQRNIKKLSDGLGEMAKGDLTVKIEADGRDEFTDLAETTSEMIYQTKSLVAKVDDAVGGVEDCANDVQNASAMLGAQSGNIAAAMSEMTEGMKQQRLHAEECVTVTDKLSDEMRAISHQISAIQGVMEETDAMISEGMSMVKTLGERAQDTTEATDSVKESVGALLVETSKINSFVETIRSLSAQTNLLSLNASIEASRAGEAGKGFAVVAEEIRNLAAESTRAAGEIKKMVEKINDQTKMSTGSVNKAREIANEQFELMKKTTQVFDRMQGSMEQLTKELEKITQTTAEADAKRLEAVESVRSISDIIGEAGENAQVVEDVLTQLQEEIMNLGVTARELGSSMDELKAEVAAFIL